MDHEDHHRTLGGGTFEAQSKRERFMSNLSDFANNGMIFCESVLLLPGDRKHFKFHDLDIQVETCLYGCLFLYAYIRRIEHMCTHCAVMLYVQT